MVYREKTKDELIKEIKLLKKRRITTGIKSTEIEQIIQKARVYAESIVETLREPLIVLDANLMVVSANDCFYQLFKISPDQTVGRSIYDLGNRQWNIPTLHHLLDNILPNNKFFNDYKIEHEFETIGPKVMLLNARRLDDVQMILLVIEDITAREKHIDELRDSENRYRIQFEQNRDALFLANAKTGILADCNQAAVKLMGWTKSEIVGSHQKKLHPPEKLDGKFTKSFKKHLSGGDILEAKIINKTGEIRDVTIKAGRINISKKDYILANFRDVTEQKKIERELKIKSFSVESAINPIAINDLNGKFIYVNPAFLKMMGYDNDSKILEMMPTDISADQEYTSTIISSVKKNGGWRGAERIKKKDGSIIDAELFSSLIKDDKQKPICIMASFIDITKQKRIEAALEKSQKGIHNGEMIIKQKNFALAELIEHLERAKTKTKEDIAINIREFIMPILHKLRAKGSPPKYIDLLEHHFYELTSSFGRSIIDKQNKLTPREIEICSLIESGLSSKEISKLINVSIQTIDKHRINIRNKLGLVHKKANLASFLKDI